MALNLILDPKDKSLFNLEEIEIIKERLGRFFELKRIEASVIILNQPEIKILNSQHRHIDEPTDVLSFPLFENLDQIRTMEGFGSFSIGDIYICPEKVILYNESISQMIHHGLLHLLGFDHVTDYKTWNSLEIPLLASYATSGLMIEEVK